MQTKECHTTKNTNTCTLQERSNLSVDTEEESSDMDNVNDRNTLCTEEAEEQPTSAHRKKTRRITLESLRD